MMWNWGMGWLGWLFMMGWWVLVVAAIVWLVRAAPGPAHRSTTARSLLDERLAAGEVTLEEYQVRRRVLDGGPRPES